MAFGRQAAAYGDENKRVEGKGAVGKGATRVPLGAAVGNNGRRALGDIGNLVGAMPSNAGGGSQKQGALAERAAYKRGLGAVNDKPTTRLAAKSAAAAASDAPAAAAAAPPLPSNWGAHRRRDLITKPRNDLAPEGGAPSGTGRSSGVSERDPLASINSNSLHPGAAAARMAKQVEARVLRKKKLGTHEQSTTSKLLAQSAAVSGNADAEMEDADEALPDIDSADQRDPLCVTQYVEDIYAFYKRTEGQSCVSPQYMGRQADINDKMRAILVDWLVEVHLKFKLTPETLFLTTNLIDRFLALHPVTRKHLQLVGVTAMLIASKYEEIWAPEVKDFVYISDNAYDKDQILAMEKLMLNTLKFNLTVPTPYVFMCRYLKAAAADKQLETTAFFLVELCLVEYAFLRFTPSLLAAAAVHTALKTLNRTPWSPALHKHSGYSETALRSCSFLMSSIHRKSATASLTAVVKKYSSSKLYCVALLPPCPESPIDDTCSSSD
ncbi:Cyclin B and related kinase-activating proteins [Klebsormidium nitens]|uniref:Cyclin B and related kinase-activating proteins n=1 Tax=Klebsormidium nitens TaxID=105231 RepID=A0A1Y1IFZ7_KLENI|nr:Cyclin B and related kinase-activating proteins [Klebsormidium nitens]|eukprot:GAQ89765.1 Cyclin B and related kinase-activating proteins [Klebsormidium nitens]